MHPATEFTVDFITIGLDVAKNSLYLSGALEAAFSIQRSEQNYRLKVTVLVIIKLTKNAVPLRFRCGSCKLKFCRYFTMVCDIA